MFISAMKLLHTTLSYTKYNNTIVTICTSTYPMFDIATCLSYVSISLSQRNHVYFVHVSDCQVLIGAL